VEIIIIVDFKNIIRSI